MGPGSREVVPGETLETGRADGGERWGQMGEGGRVCGPGVLGSASHHWFSVPPPSLPQEERALSGTLEASKALLEEQLEAAQERCARLHETQRENLLLRTRLGEAHAVSFPDCPLVNPLVLRIP